MMIVDRFLLDRFDRAAGWAQRKGVLLTDIHVHVAGLTVATTAALSYARHNLWVMGFCLIVWGTLFGANVVWASQNSDYPVNVRKMERLNAMALSNREIGLIFRLMLAVLWLSSIPFDIANLFNEEVTIAILSQLASLSTVSYFYVQGCFFLGPGEFSKKKQMVTTGQESLSHGS